MMSGERATMWAPGTVRNSTYWNGGAAKWVLISWVGLASAIAASGWPSCTVLASSRPDWSAP